jgi:hypothetical protein
MVSTKEITDYNLILKFFLTNSVNDMMKNLKKILDRREEDWVKSQDFLFKQRPSKHQEDAHKFEEESNILLKLCKTWGGPFTEFPDFEKAWNQPNQQEKHLKKILKSEISFRKITYPRDVVDRPTLYKLNKLSVIDLKTNLSILLSTSFECPIVEIPSEDDVLEMSVRFICCNFIIIL